MSNITHNNHYVPQFYLKNWSKNNNTIWVYSLLVPNSKVPYWEEKSIKSVAVWKDLYTRTDGTNEVDDFEKWFNKEFETPAEPIIKKLINGENISNQENINLTRFVLAQHLRVPAQMDHSFGITKKAFHSAFDSNPFERIDKNALQNYKPIENKNASLLPIKVKIDSEANTAEVNTFIGRGAFLFSLREILTKTVTKVQNQRWQVLHAADGVSFPTSDNPVICLSYHSNNDYEFIYGGWGKKNINIIMPLSPKHLLFTQVGDKKKIPSTCSIDMSEFFRKIIIENAFRYVYAEERQRHMLAINPRIINYDLFIKEKKFIEGWNNEQIKAELELWSS